MTPITLRLLGLATLSFVPLAAAQPAAYAGREIQLTIVDDETGAPLAGVAVAAQWNLVRDLGVFVRRDLDVLTAQEALSDAAGRVVLPAWGPAVRPLLTRLDDEEPQILAFLPGYYPRIVHDKRGMDGPVRSSRWDGETIRMRRYTGAAQSFEEFDGRFRTPVAVEGTVDEYAMRIGDLQGRLGWRKDDERWMRHPRMVAAILRERARLAPQMGPKIAVISSRAALSGEDAKVGKILGGDVK